MFRPAVKPKFPKYYKKEVEGKAYRNLILDRHIIKVFTNDSNDDSNTVSKTNLSVTVYNHFSVVDPSEKLIKETDWVLRLVEVKGIKFLLSEFTYDYYFQFNQFGYSSVVILFVKKDIFGNYIITTELHESRMELFEIKCGSNIEGSIRCFLGNNMQTFELTESSISELKIKQIGSFSRLFERKLIGCPINVHTAVCLVVDEVMVSEQIDYVNSVIIRFDVNLLRDNEFKKNFGDVTRKIIMDWYGIESDSTLDTVTSLKDLTYYKVESDNLALDYYG